VNGVLHRPAGPRSWDRFPLRNALAAQLGGVPVHVDKDTNVAVLRAAGSRGTAYVHLADGLGAGLLLNGTVYRGARTNAGEFGHQVVQLDGPPCPCGGRGCLEALCLAALAAGDRREAARLVGIGAANLVRLLDIDRIVLGGRAVLAEPEVYRDGVRAQLAASLPEPEWQHVEVGLAPAGLSAVAVGAAELILGPLAGSTRSAPKPCIGPDLLVYARRNCDHVGQSDVCKKKRMHHPVFLEVRDSLLRAMDTVLRERTSLTRNMGGVAEAESSVTPCWSDG
jgi:predicted NBD/HSP70 family sugar kinase